MTTVDNERSQRAMQQADRPTPSKTPTGAPATLVELVATFRGRGSAPAILTFREHGVDTLAYAELAESVENAAAQLRQRGIGAGDKVLLWGPNGPDWVVAYFGIVCAGAVAVPLDVQSGTRRVASVLEHARPKLAFSTRSLMAELDEAGVAERPECLWLDIAQGEAQTWREPTAENTRRLPAVETDSLASLLYTSGTTGTPKAVPLTHGNLASNLAALLEAKLIGANDRVLLPLPLHHTYPFTAGLLTPLGAGATVILPAGISGPQISRAAAESGATVLLAVPRLCSALWDSITAGARARGPTAERWFARLLRLSMAIRRLVGLRIGRALFGAVHAKLGRNLRLIGCGGAKLDAELEQRLEGLGWRVLTGYGLTETSPVLTFNRPGKTKQGTAGQPVPGVKLRIEPRPGLEHGEIQAQGPNVFAAYWQNDSATKATFTDDGWFKTGDLGWIDDGGYLHVTGRSKEVIVLPDGKNVYPEEVEKIYAESSPLFREVAVLDADDSLVGLIVPDDGAVREQGTLRQATLLREAVEDSAAKLAPYQRIGEYRITREPLPRTRLGKLQRHLLPQRYRDAAIQDSQNHDSEPSAEDKKLLATQPLSEVWRWLEGRFPERSLSLDTSPQLDLKIDSLEWVTLTLELEQRFGAALTGEAVSRILTLRDLLKEIATAPPRVVSAQTFEPPGLFLRCAGAVFLGLARLLMRTLFRLRVTGVEQLADDAPLVIVPNHVSYLDPIAVAAALPWQRVRKTYWAGWVGKMHAGPFSRFLSRATQVFPVDPDRDLAGAIATARAVLEHGYSLVWFPEGRRSPSGELEPFQLGIGALLKDSSAQAVPTAIHGSYEAWPRQRRWPKLGRVRIAFGPPMPVADLLASAPGRGDMEAIRAALHDEVAQLLANYHP